MSIKVGGVNGQLTIDQGTETDLTITAAQLKPLTVSWDGVPYVDPDAIGASPTAKIYPDGSIVGSTDNGSYTKWANGDLVIKQITSGSSTFQSEAYSFYRGVGVDSIDYPVAFVGDNVPTASVYLSSSLGVAVFVINTPSTQTNSNFAPASLTSLSTRDWILRVTATGRWK